MTAEAAEIIGKRYQLLRKLGEGGMGAVYVAYDRLMKQEVALKRIRTIGANQAFEFASDMAEFHLALAREFKVLASLRHPHIISVLDYGFEEVDSADGRQPYFTMELLANARPFVEAAVHTKVLDQQIALISQLLQALAYLHRCGILHRDLKPGNLLVSPSGQLKVLDFGLATDVKAESEEPMGTLLYMAPEVVKGERASTASDLYAVGIMLYELIVGRHPFSTENITQLIEEILNASPDLSPIPDAPLEDDSQTLLWRQPSTSAKNLPSTTRMKRDVTRQPEITKPLPSDDSAPTIIPRGLLAEPPTMRLTKIEPDDTDEDSVLSEENQLSESHVRHSVRQIIARLLAKSPTERYQDAYVLIRDLCAAVGAPIPQETVAIRESFLQAAAFVGRETELNQLETALVKSTFNQGSAWLIAGDIGIGKSRLLDELRTRALIEGVLVLRGQTVAEGGVPYQLWRDPLRRLVLSTDLDDLDAGILKGVLPDMDDLTGRPIKEAAVLTGTDFQKRLNGAIVSLFARQTQPILLLLEDLQWASDETLAVLNVVTGLCNDHPLLIVGSFRLDEAPSLGESLPGMKLLKLERLSREHVKELSGSILGAVGQIPQFVEMLATKSEGNAYFMIEIVRALAEEVGRMDAVDSQRMPRTLFAGGIQEVIQRRLRRVPDWALPLLQLAAVAGRELDLKLIRHLAADVDVETWLATCANCAVLEIQNEQWRFCYDNLREGILSVLAAEVLANLHRQVAEGIETIYPDDPQQAAALAGHWGSAKNVHKEFDYARRAGAYGLQLCTFEEAVSHLERALELLAVLFPSENDLQSKGHEANLLTLLGETRLYTGNYKAASFGLQASLDLLTDLDDQTGLARTFNLLGDVAWRQGEYAEAKAYCDQGLTAARTTNDQENIARALNRLGMVALEQGDYPEARRCLEESLSVANTLDMPGLRVSPTNNLGILAFYQGDYAQSRQRLEETLALCRAIGERGKVAMILSNLGSLAGAQDDLEAATHYFEQSLSISRAIGDRHSMIQALENLGALAELQERYTDAVRHLGESLTLANAIGNRKGSAATTIVLANVMHKQGDDSQATTLFKNALTIAQSIDSVPFMLDALVGLAQVIPDKTRALEWLGLALSHPSTTEGTRQTAENLRVQLTTGILTPETAAEILKRGQALDFKQVIAEILTP